MNPSSVGCFFVAGAPKCLTIFDNLRYIENSPILSHYTAWQIGITWAITIPVGITGGNKDIFDSYCGSFPKIPYELSTSKSWLVAFAGHDKSKHWQRLTANS